MSLFVIITDIASIIVALILAIISARIINITRVKGIRKTVYKPIVIAGLIFVIGCFFALIHEFFKEYIFEVMHHLSWLIALIIIAQGSYDYMKMLEKAGQS